ncbi:hypothetical protein VNO78_06336 [Psophocarpus tetragonolobus]|uniref:NAD(P)H dehydrogenase (quinone) n=1 Tax=Psophocarpus tetragonolobus TaxID=3891 RepID=A0AAN9T158_PSOTE
MFGHVERLAREIKEGADSVQGVESQLWQVPETLSDEALRKLKAPPKSDVPIITKNQLQEADGFVFGFPTRFGMIPAQFQAFLDSTGLQWDKQEHMLEGKPAGIFFSTSGQGGGQETTALTAIAQLVNHGMLFVPIGYRLANELTEMTELRGGGPYGAGTYAGNGKRNPTEIELRQAFHQGEILAIITKKLKSNSHRSFRDIARRL